jgi:hypothetical protein
MCWNIIVKLWNFVQFVKVKVKVRVKQSLYQRGQALRVLEG